VTVEGLVSGAEIDAPVNLSVQVTGELPLERVRLTVDGAILAELTSPPYEVSLDPAAYSTGSHVLRAEAIDTAGGVGSAELGFVAAAPSGGGPSSGLLMIGVLLLLLAVAGAAGLVAIARRRLAAPVLVTRIRPWSGRRNGEPEPRLALGGSASELPTLSDEPLGRLVVAAGPRQGEAIEVGARPRRIGSAPHCDLVLTDEDGGVAPEEARVWVSEGRLMYHKLTRLTAFASEGPTSGWFVLQDGDEVRVGSHRLVFQVQAPDDGVAEALAALERASAQQPADRASEEDAPQSTAQAGEESDQTSEPEPSDDIDPDADEY
jgi:hypothetical protein